MCDEHPFCHLCDVDLLMNANVLPGELEFIIVAPKVRAEHPLAYDDHGAIHAYLTRAKVENDQYKEMCLDADIDSEFGEEELPTKPKLPKVSRSRRNEDRYGDWGSSDEDEVPDEYLSEEAKMYQGIQIDDSNDPDRHVSQAERQRILDQAFEQRKFRREPRPRDNCDQFIPDTFYNQALDSWRGQWILCDEGGFRVRLSTDAEREWVTLHLANFLQYTLEGEFVRHVLAAFPELQQFETSNQVRMDLSEPSHPHNVSIDSGRQVYYPSSFHPLSYPTQEVNPLANYSLYVPQNILGTSQFHSNYGQTTPEPPPAPSPSVLPAHEFVLPQQEPWPEQDYSLNTLDATGYGDPDPNE